MSDQHTALEKEFELERLILFSDAVFAIAITLLIIEIKFPEVEKGATASQIFALFVPTIIQFLAFCISFIFIGISWARHLQMCRFLRRYDTGLIKRNLILLFFIVCFPFSVSGITEHIRPSFMLPVFVYLVNIAGVMCSQYAFAYYIFDKKPELSTPDLTAEKRYLLLKYKWTAVIFLVVFSLYTILSIVFPQQTIIPVVAIYLLPVLLFIMRRKLKPYKPDNA